MRWLCEESLDTPVLSNKKNVFNVLEVLNQGYIIHINFLFAAAEPLGCNGPLAVKSERESC